MNGVYFMAFALSAALSAAVTPLAQRLAHRWGAIDRPGDPRRIHTRPTPRLGGLAIFASIFTASLLYLDPSRQLVGLLGGLTVLLVVGAVDDVRGVSPWVKLGWQIVAAGVALSGGIGIYQVANPFGGVVDLDWGRTAVNLGGLSFHITPVANLLSVIWIVGLVNVINFLDGLDGLACGTSGIAAFILFLLAVGPMVNQPEVAVLAIIVVGACLGFLPFNFFPARIFLGDSGAYTLGLTLALLAIYSGGKVATASLVLGFTIIDALWTVARRLYHHQSPFKADRKHLHHLLLDAGLNQRQTVLGLYVFAMVFGLIALATDSYAKIVTALGLVVLMTLILGWLMWRSRRKA
jgi:UDP-GlcNAc:undecaprenyl-phosphate/decaprenyl-phosphate GlcNAc-1-phosphate transferase